MKYAPKVTRTFDICHLTLVNHVLCHVLLRLQEISSSRYFVYLSQSYSSTTSIFKICHIFHFERPFGFPVLDRNPRLL